MAASTPHLNQRGPALRTACQDYLTAVSRGTVHQAKQMLHQGFSVDACASLRPDGTTQVSVKARSLGDGRVHTAVWVVERRRRSSAMTYAIDRTCRALQLLFPHPCE
jgi:hypothetical protein